MEYLSNLPSIAYFDPEVAKFDTWRIDTGRIDTGESWVG
jgi:hypothetical protein